MNRQRQCMMAAMWLALAMLAGRAEAASRYWVASTDGNWNDTANWSPSSGGGGGESVPGSSDDAIFDGGGAGDCNLDTAVNVLGLRIESGFTGTVIQTDKTVMIGINGYYQAGGVFHHNNGTLGFDSQNSSGNNTPDVRTVRVSKPLTLKHLSFGRGNSYSGRGLRYSFDLADGGEVIVEGDFALNPQYYVTLSGTINVRGNVAVGDKSVGGGALRVDGTGNQTYTSHSSGTWPALNVAKPSGSFAPVNLTDTTLVVRVSTFTLADGTFVAPAGRMDILNTAMTTFSFTNGTFTANGGKLRMASYHANGGGAWHSTIYLRKPLTLKDLTYDGGNSSSRNAYYTLDIAGEGRLLVEGDFSMKYNDPTPNYGLLANGGTIEVKGNVGIGTLAKGGTTRILLSGANSQIITHAAGIPPQGSWTIDKSGGAAILASNLTLSGATQDLVWTNGAIVLATNRLTIGRNVAIHAGATTLGVTIADATTAGWLSAAGAVAGISNAVLAMAVDATQEQVDGQTYTVLTNSTSLGAETFEDVT